jgi:hypothetical protein
MVWRVGVPLLYAWPIMSRRNPTMGQDLSPRIAELTALCVQQRQTSRRPHYSDETKVLVRELKDAGIGPTALAHAAGVAVSAINNWLKESSAKASRPSATKPPPPPVKMMQVERDTESVLGRQLVATIRAGDYEVVVYAHGGRP